MIKQLQESVMASFGGVIAQSKDCKLLRDSVLKDTGRLISEATLRRFFGLLPTNSKPSRATLDVLAVYAGYGSWNEFCQSCQRGGQASNQPDLDVLWAQMAQAAAAHSRTTTNRIRISSGIGFDIAANRHFIAERMRSFMQSGCGATALVAPGGYGKSTALAKWYVQYGVGLAPDIVLFVHSRQFEGQSVADMGLAPALQQLLGLSPDSSFMDSYFTKPEHTPPGRLLLIIDGLDELQLRGNRLVALYQGLVELVQRYTRTGFLKVVLASRSHEWGAMQRQIEALELWYGVAPEHFSAQKANIPGLTFDEVQQVFDRSVNRRLANRLLVYAMPLDLCLTVSYPYYLQLFVRLYASGSSAVMSDHIGLLLEFMKRQIYDSPLAEQKDDILSYIVTQSGYGRRGVSKNDLKAAYPVHLRKDDGYYAAYDEMLSFGIIGEDVVDSPSDGYSCSVRIANANLLCVLSAQCIMKSKGSRAAVLVQWLQREFATHEYQVEVLSAIFKLAYLQERRDILEHFFALDEVMLNRVMDANVVNAVLPSNPKLYKHLLSRYMSNEKARRVLIERNVDINHMALSYMGMLMAYADAISDERGEAFARAMLGYGGLLTLNRLLIQANAGQMGDEPASELPPAALGAWFAGALVGGMVRSGSQMRMEQWATTVRGYLHKMPADERFEAGELVLIAISTIAPMKVFAPIADEVLNGNEASTPHRRAVSHIVRLYVQALRRETISPEQLNTLPQHYTWLSRQRSVPYIIMGETIRAMLHMGFGNLEQVAACMRNGIELAAASGLTLFEASLLLRLAHFMEQMGEKQWAQEIRASGQTLLANSGVRFSPSLLD